MYSYFRLVGDFSYFFFFKQKTAYEMRISDWSSDVCSSDLQARPSPIKRGSAPQVRRVAVAAIVKSAQQPPAAPKPVEARVAAQAPAPRPARPEIGRAHV